MPAFNLALNVASATELLSSRGPWKWTMAGKRR